jgi:hypothetical protein
LKFLKYDWFVADFKTKGSVIDFLNQYSTTKINSAKVNFKEYNWGLMNKSKSKLSPVIYNPLQQIYIKEHKPNRRTIL